MKVKRLLHVALIPVICYGQVETIMDSRDEKTYRTTKINNTLWMLDNLDYFTEMSNGLTSQQIETYSKFNLHGRYYHFLEVDSVCPPGWRLPNVQDWTDYFNYLVKDHRPRVKLEVLVVDDPNHYTSFINYSKRIDLFKPGNPLNLNPTGRIEGTVFNIPDVYADYYTRDDRETFSGRSHIHIMNVYTTIHSHEHNMQPDKEEELRKFMVRCVKPIDDN
jgi:uncharacterized protein (TIGR02145 family)